MPSKKTDLQKQVDDLVGQLGKAGTDSARNKLTLRLLRFSRPELVEHLNAAFKRQLRYRWVFPSVLNKLADNKVPGVKDSLVRLLADKDPAVRANAARAVAARGWADDCITELLRVAAKEVPPDPFLAALEALATGGSTAAFEALLILAARKIKNPWRRGNILEGLAMHSRPEARSVFQQALEKSKEHPYVQLMAALGLARLGDQTALDILRRGLDADDPDVATAAADGLHKILGTPKADSDAQLKRLRKWWDDHPDEVAARFKKPRNRR